MSTASCTVAIAQTLSDKRRLKPHNALFLPKALLGVLFAFPLGIASALADAVPVFTSILPISALCALVCPIIVPLITASGLLLASWLGARALVRILIRTGMSIAARIAADGRAARALHILLHVHEIAYMGLYGAFVLSGAKSSESESRVPPEPLTRRPRTRLVIPNIPKFIVPNFPLTPPSSDPSYTPTRSPTLTEGTDTSSPSTPVDEPTYSSLARLSSLLHTLEDDQLDVVVNYVEILKKGRTAP